MSLSKLTHLSLLKITGEDAAGFLQGQLTNDVEKLDGNWHYTGYCNPKGRLLAVLMLWRKGDEFYAVLEKSVAESTFKRLKMYVLRSKVLLEELTDTHCFGALDEQSHSLFSSIAMNQVAFSDSEGTTALSFGNRYLLVSKGVSEEESGHCADSNHQWIQKDIAAGLPRVTAQSVELFIPQMLNLDLVSGISFKKGCYTGQEIVARMHYLGKLKQRQYLCQINRKENLPSETMTKIGDKVVLASDPGKTAGIIANSTSDDHELLIVLRSEYAGTTELESQHGERITVCSEQPVAIPKSNN